MIHAAGVLLLTKDGSALFLKRSYVGDGGGLWCIPGGKLEEGEDAKAAACRELGEEIGFTCDPNKLEYHTRRIAPAFVPSAPPPVIPVLTPVSNPVVNVIREGVKAPEPMVEVNPAETVDFTTFVLRGVDQFIPKLNEEHVAFAWATADQPPEPLHPGCRISLARLGKGWTELDTAKAIMNGELTSPQYQDNIDLFAMRITGTGAAYRHKWGEFVWRDPSLYLNEEFLQRCNGLPVIWEHPKKSATLDSKEFTARAVGTILLPYIKGEEVWGIAKIYDAEAAGEMRTEQLSTSPAVVWRDPDVNSKVEMEDGSRFLIEGKPSLLDHLAICERGVWDKGGGPTGIETTIGDSAMAADSDKEKDKGKVDQATLTAAADSAKLDSKLDLLLTRTEAVGVKLDSLATRVDSVEAQVKARKDDDDDHKKDEDKDEKKDSAKKDEDKDEKKDDDDDRKDGDEKDKPKELAADKKRRKDDDDDRKDAAKKDEDKDEKKDDDDRKDEDKDKDEKKDGAADSVTVKELQAQLLELKSKMPKELTDAEHDSFAKVQARYDAVYSLFGKSAGRPMSGETLLAYRRRMANGLKEHSKWSKADLGVAAVDDATMTIAEDDILKAAADAALNPARVPEGHLHAITETLPTGHVRTKFVGRPSAWMGHFSSNKRAIVGINTFNNGNQRGA